MHKPGSTPAAFCAWDQTRSWSSGLAGATVGGAEPRWPDTAAQRGLALPLRQADVPPARHHPSERRGL